MTKAYYRPDEVAEYFSLSKKTIYRRIRKGEIAAIRMNGRYRIHLDEIRRIETENKIQSQPETDEDSPPLHSF